MFDSIYEGLRKATEAAVQVQQETFQKWIGLSPAAPAAAPALDPARFQKRWLEAVAGLTRRQRGLLEAQWKVGVKYVEGAFRLAEARTPEELRDKAVELWKQTFDALRQLYEGQAREFQAAVARLGRLVPDGAAGAGTQEAKADAPKAAAPANGRKVKPGARKAAVR
jgi:hypothetical protein